MGTQWGLNVDHLGCLVFLTERPFQAREIECVGRGCTPDELTQFPRPVDHSLCLVVATEPRWSVR